MNINHTAEPLAALMRPITLQDYVGQAHLLGENAPLHAMIKQKTLHSMILWGPPGSGKTTLAKILSNHCQGEFHALSAVLAGVKEIRLLVDHAKKERLLGKRTILFIDEIHRFNKAQQDVLLPFIEEGLFTLIGATTENPSFELNQALLSRVRVFVLKALDHAALKAIILRTIDTIELKAEKQETISMTDETMDRLIELADGDARRALSLFELAYSLVKAAQITNTKKQIQTIIISLEILRHASGVRLARFDKQGDQFYGLISALHKAVRGSSPDAALYWYARMLEGGCDPLYIARRVVRMASEDIGNADPRALAIALNAWEAQQRLGSPEGELCLAQAIVFLACAAKSNAVYVAFKQARNLAQQTPSLNVPAHLLNAPSQLMKELGYGKEYRYAHDEPEGYAAGENYFPPELKNTQFYTPVSRGLEIRIKEKLDSLKKLDEVSTWQRY